jgi:hypothetical protein
MALRSVAERTVAEADDWYQVYGAENGYEKMMDLFHELGIGDVHEKVFEQNVDNDRFYVEVVAEDEYAGSSNITKKFEVKMFSRDPLEKTDRGRFGIITVEIDVSLKLEFPDHPEWMPNVLVKFLRRIWWRTLLRRQWRRAEEEAEEKVRGFVNLMRKFYSLEPAVGKTRRVYYQPLF